MKFPRLKKNIIAIPLVVALFLIAFHPKSLAHPANPKVLSNHSAIAASIHYLERIFNPPPQNSAETLEEKFQGKIIYKIRPRNSEKLIALTFDDGPHGETTLQVLDILEEHNVKATFFLIGTNLEKYPYVGRKIARLGHGIGNHTWSHAYESMDRETAALEIEETSTAIAGITGVQTKLFRPPLGKLNNGLVSYAQERGYIIALWSIDSGDAVGYPGVQTIVDNVLNNAHPGGIVLLHDAPRTRWKTIQALPKIIERLQAEGYRFVTVPELLAMGQEESAIQDEE